MKIAPYLRNMMGAFVLTAMMGTGVASARAQTVGEKHYELNASDEVNDILSRMHNRHISDLKTGLDQQYIALTTSGWLNVRVDKIQHFTFEQQQHLNKTIQDENKDRKSLQKIVAQAHGNPNVENALREHFAEEWLKAAENSQWIIYNPHFKTFRTIT